jgi:hypothetical protein
MFCKAKHFTQKAGGYYVKEEGRGYYVKDPTMLKGVLY